MYKGTNLSLLAIIAVVLVFICYPTVSQAQPANDLCANADPIPDGDTAFITIGAVMASEGAQICGNSGSDIWYNYTATCTGNLFVSTCNQADYDTTLAVFDGSNCSDALNDNSTLDCNDNAFGCGFTSEVVAPVITGQQYLIRVAGFNGAHGTGDISIVCTLPPSNDLCANAIGPLAVDSVTCGSTIGAGFDDVGFCGTTNTTGGVLYTVIGTGNTMTASTCNDGNPATGSANYDTKISVFCATCDLEQCVAVQDDFGGCAGFSTKLSWPTVTGAEYLILVHGLGSATGDFDLAILDDGTPVDSGVLCGVNIDIAPGN